MRVFQYEYVTGGGWFEHSKPPRRSLIREAEAMGAAVGADFAALAGVQLFRTRDARFPQIENPGGCCTLAVSGRANDREAFKRLAGEADWTLVIAPESGGALLERARMVQDAGGRLLSPPPACIEVAGNKQRTAELLKRQGVPTPHGVLLTEASRDAIVQLGFPLVAKPVDGCGSEGVRLVKRGEGLTDLLLNGSVRVESYVPGLAASVAVLCGPAGDFVLPACQQRLSADGCFTYWGGLVTLDQPLSLRASRLALAAVAALGPRQGYLGVDLVLGDSAEGTDDYVIEINPRLTTSYVGLRAAARCNLAAAMLAVCQGDVPDLCFDDRPLEFTVDGSILSRCRVQ